MSSSDVAVPLIPTYIAAGRFAVEGKNNHAGSIWISTLLCLVYSTLIFATRAHLRWNVFALDDYLILVATVLQAGEVGSLIAALQSGLGQAHAILTAEQTSNANLDTFVGIILFIASTCFSKLSVIFLMMRLFNLNGPRSSSDKRTRLMWAISWGFAALTISWGVLSMIGVSVHCSIRRLTDQASNNGCPAQDLRWNIITAVDVLTEVVLVLLSIAIVWPVQMKLAMKVPIVLAFTFRLPCAALSIIHLCYIHRYVSATSPSLSSSSSSSQTTADPGNAIVPVIVIMQVQLCWSIISATIPNLKSFVRSFNSGCGLGIDQDFILKYGSSSRTRSTRPDTECDISSPTTDLGNVSNNAEARRASAIANSLSSFIRNSYYNHTNNNDSLDNERRRRSRRSFVETPPIIVNTNTATTDTDEIDRIMNMTTPDTRGRDISRHPSTSGYRVDILSHTPTRMPTTTTTMTTRKTPSPNPITLSSSLATTAMRWKTKVSDNDTGSGSKERHKTTKRISILNNNNDYNKEFDADDNDNDNDNENSSTLGSWIQEIENNTNNSNSNSNNVNVNGGGNKGVIRKDMQYSVHYEPK